MKDVKFNRMTEPAMRDWVTKNAGRVNELDDLGYPLLIRAAYVASPSFAAELVDTYGADVSKRTGFSRTVALHWASSTAMISVLLKRGPDPLLELNGIKLGCPSCSELLQHEF